MNDFHDDTEIKIEYIESFEVDPLLDNKEQVLEGGCDLISLNKASNRITDDVSFDSHPAGHEIAIRNEKNSVIETEDVRKWHKYVDNMGQYVCKFCTLPYTTIQTLRNHIRIKHTQEYCLLKNTTITGLRQRKSKCHVCKKQFKTITDLQAHIEYHGLYNIKMSCYICHATFGSTAEMLNHVNNEHSSKKNKLYFCSTCGYCTAKLSHLKQHEYTHTHNNKRKCMHCDYSTNYLPNLKIHERIHTNDKPYVCDYAGCDYRCAAKSAMYSHQLKHNKEKNMLFCDKCSYSTVYKQSLKKHIDSHKRNTVRKRI